MIFAVFEVCVAACRR